MKIYSLLLLLALFLFTQCKKSAPTSFSQDALNQKVETKQGSTLSLEAVFEQHKGEILFIDIWASWCGDCLQSIPEVKRLKEKYEREVTFLYFSMDKTKENWLTAIEEYELGGTHLYMGSEWKSKFNQSINLTWIPRFMIVGKDGSIKLFNAEKADDHRIEDILTRELRAK